MTEQYSVRLADDPTTDPIGLDSIGSRCNDCLLQNLCHGKAKAPRNTILSYLIEQTLQNPLDELVKSLGLTQILAVEGNHYDDKSMYKFGSSDLNPMVVQTMRGGGRQAEVTSTIDSSGVVTSVCKRTWTQGVFRLLGMVGIIPTDRRIGKGRWNTRKPNC